MNARKFTFISIAILVVFGMAFGMTRYAFADHNIGVFELDRNALDDGAVLGDDWDTLYNGDGSADAFTGILPDIGSPGTQFQGGGSKDNSDINEWLWKPGEPLDKDDITDAYAAAYINPADGDLIIYYGLDRFANNGSAQVGFWFFQNPVGLTNIPRSGGYEFSGLHTVGDVLVQSNFSQGGVISSISVFEWVGSGGSNGALDLVFTAQDCLGGALPTDPACATVNQASTTAPWPYTPKSGPANIFPQGSFFEGGLDISDLVPDAGCFTGFLAETRTSTPFDARLKDFVLGNFTLCNISVTKTGDTLSKVGDPADYTITIQNTGALPLYKDDITDTLLGNITINGLDQANPYVLSNTCGASLAVGASCTITLQRTVQAGDADPLPNTVTVVYRGKADLSGNAVSSTDDHSVNLFQPSITFDKSVSANLSKVGDSVDYTLTLNNTSSSDTPALLCTINDSTLGISKSVTLASGASDVTTLSYTFQPGDLDPFNNTASVSCSPDGFPNVLTASDSASVNLFQPAIAVDKTGDTLSKVGDAVDYTITLSNNSSADTPALNCTASDSLLGSLFSGVLPLGDTIINTSRTVVAGDLDPLANTVTLTCSPAGFPNVLSASASHETNLFQPSITFDKIVSANLSKAGDSVDYTLTLNNTSSSDTPDLVCAVSDPTLGISKNVTLASGGSDVTNQSYTFGAGDADPFNNTASVTCSPTGFPNVLTASDSESVNLFQPALAVAKTGDDLSKVGDPVDYVITLSNNSSADSPALNCTASDSLLGLVFSGVLPLGDTTINLSRTVQPGDLDPLVNTVDVTCGVAGFSNVLTGSASHTTELFQPSVQVIKTGPDTAAKGQTVTYSFTINNTSSSDSPDLVLASVLDTVIGDITANALGGGCGTLASGGSCSFTADYTTQLDDPNPLVNVVTVLYHPDGFPNDISASDDHSLTFPAQGCTPGWWKNKGFGAWDQPSDALAIAVTTAVADYWYGGIAPAGFDGTHGALFRDAFNLTSAQMSAVGVDPNLTLLGAIQLNGGNYFALARQGTAALLNSVSVDYPYDANTVLQLVHDAIANQNIGDLINQFTNANNLDHSSCPTG